MSKNKMNPKVKKLWVKSLEKEEYKQGKGRLRNNNDELCCLGVLCELHRKAMRNSKYYWDLDNNYVTPNANKAFALPKSVIKWAGLVDDLGTINNTSYLADLNDNGKTFKEIAKIIQKEL